MTRKSAFYALAVAVLTGILAVGALADDPGASMYGPADSSVSSQPEQGVESPDAGEIREPLETGSVPDRSEGPSAPDLYGDDPTYWPGGP